jgi:hypothetical protein
MKKGNFHPGIVSVILLSALAAPPRCLAQGMFQVLGGRVLRYAVPHDFYLEGKAFPVERRNSVLIKTPSGARTLVALIVTSGWVSQAPHKFLGMLITEGPLSVCGNRLGVGSYGFGLHRQAAISTRHARFVLYNQAGQEVGQCEVPKDLRLKEPRPLRVVVDTPHAARLYLGRYWIDLQP